MPIKALQARAYSGNRQENGHFADPYSEFQGIALLHAQSLDQHCAFYALTQHNRDPLRAGYS
jgi:hypothetical protein